MLYETPGGPVHPLYKDMLEEHNVLIAGQIGSGKSVILNGIIYTALTYKFPGYGPKCAQLILIDPKRVEFLRYKSLPHTIAHARDLDDILSALDRGERIMMERYTKAERAGLQEWTEDGDLYIIVDELAFVLQQAKKLRKVDILPALIRLAELGRAAHVHLIVATQHPSRKSIPAELRDNMSCKVALHCGEAIESRQILGNKRDDAIHLPEFGKCVYKSSRKDWIRLVPMYSAEEISERVKWWTDQKPTVLPKKSFLQRLFCK